MTKINLKGHKKIWVNIILFTTTALVITTLFPLKGEFKYEFTQGKPWQHNDFFSPIDFSIHKTSQQISNETDSLMETVNPYFSIDSTISNSVYIEVTKKLQKTLPDSLLNLKNNILNSIKKYYNDGVFDDDVSNLEKNDIELINGKFTKTISRNDLNTVDSIIYKLENKFGHNINLISDIFKPNTFYDETTTQQIIDNEVYNASKAYGYIKKGEKIIFKGEIVNENYYRILNSLKDEFEIQAIKDANVFLIIIGRFLLVFLLLWFLYLFLLSYRKDIFINTKNILFLLIIIFSFVVTSRLVISFDKLSIYIIPFAIIPVIVRTFFDGRLGLYISIVSVLMIAGMVPNPYEFVFFQISASMTAIFTLQNINERGKLFTTAGFVGLTYSIIYLASSFIQVGNFTQIDNNKFVWFLGNGLLLLSSYPLIYVFERMFGFLSDVTLLELADSNQPLLRNLAEKTPGTFQHSMQVANIAEEITRKLNGNALLARTGALYHDIGKSLHPQYFIENQTESVNPHDHIEFEKSAEIIINHVNEGVELAKKHKLPEQIIDFIKMHHGVSKVQYFYKSFVKKYPDVIPNETKFTYPGPRPNTKETAIVMVSDSVEAASRSLKLITEASISNLVDNIFDNILNSGQLMYTNLTFNDVTLIRKILKEKLISIYHGRIEYPK